MKKTNRHWIIALGLVASLSLPGLAFADGWNRVPQKFAGQHYQQRHHEHARDGYQHREFARRDDDHHEWREHRHYRHFDRDDYRRHEWREHEWREHAYRHDRRADYYGYRVYHGAYWSGPFVPSSVGLLIRLR